MRGNTNLPPDPLMPEPPRDAAFDTDLDAWVLSRYADVMAAFREPGLLPASARRDKNLRIPDADAQQLLRAQVLDAFSSSRLNEWQMRLERAAGMLAFDGLVDLVSEFAEPWCLAAAEIVTGSAPADRRRLLAAARVVSAASAEPLDEHLRCPASLASAELESYFADRCSNAPAVPMAAPTFVALSRTNACLLASGWLALLRHPVELAQLSERPEQIPKAIEEILRYACLPQSVVRCASKPIALCGLRIAEGDRVILRLASANRDPKQFADPNRIDFARRGAAQLSLGFGPHSCVGAALIRMSTIAATRVFVEKFSGAEICGTVEWQGGSGFRSPAVLRVR
jgi:cytochrome P450